MRIMQNVSMGVGGVGKMLATQVINTASKHREERLNEAFQTRNSLLQAFYTRNWITFVEYMSQRCHVNAPFTPFQPRSPPVPSLYCQYLEGVPILRRSPCSHLFRNEGRFSFFKVMNLRCCPVSRCSTIGWFPISTNTCKFSVSINKYLDTMYIF